MYVRLLFIHGNVLEGRKQLEESLKSATQNGDRLRLTRGETKKISNKAVVVAPDVVSTQVERF